VLFHPVEFDDWKSAAIGTVGRIFGYPTRWVHTSLRLSLLGDDGSRHDVIHDYTDHGVISYTEPLHKCTGIVRLVVAPNEYGLDYVSDVLDQINRLRVEMSPLDWWQAVPILKRQEPDKLVCTTFITEVLGTHHAYRCPVDLFKWFKDKREQVMNDFPVIDVLYWEN